MDDWLKTPGIAHHSIKEIESVPKEKRWRRAVVLGFDLTSERGRKMKANHDRLMNNLRDRYWDMKRGKEGEMGQKANEVTAKPEVSFGTLSTFCDKSGKRVGTETLPSAPSPSIPDRKPLRTQQQQQWNWDARVPSVGKTGTAFQGYSKDEQRQQTVARPVSTEGANTQCTKTLEGVYQSQQKQSNDASPCPPPSPPPLPPSEIDKPSPPSPSHEDVQPVESEKGNILLSPVWGTFGGTNAVGVEWGTFKSPTVVVPLRENAYASLSSPNCSTPNEFELMSQESSPGQNQGENMPINAKPSFEEVKSPLKCGNIRVKEKVRRYDKEPTAAGKKYLKPLDRVQNSDFHRLQTEIKFDKKRVKNWVGRFAAFPPVKKEMIEARPRRYSDPIADVPEYDNLLVREKETVVEKRKEDEMFERMVRWMVKEGVEWPVEDKERVNFPREGAMVRVRVVEARGEEATIVPPKEFERVAERLKKHIEIHRPTRVSEWAEEQMVVILEQESDTMGVNEYRRGWMYMGDRQEVTVLLIDERRIVRVPRSSLFTADESVVSCSPPLCVAAHFQKEAMTHEKDLLLLGCAAECRVMEKNGEERDRLQLALHKIDTSAVTLDVYFCGEECAGACAYHQEEKGK